MRRDQGGGKGNSDGGCERVWGNLGIKVGFCVRWGAAQRARRCDWCWWGA